MGGPGASVWLRDPLAEEQRKNLDLWLRSITRTLEVGDHGVYSFWLKKDMFAETVTQCLFYLSLGDPADQIGEDERRQIIEHLGYIPKQSISISSGCNQESDHRTLGLLTLHLAEVYHGLINMEGAIQPPHPPRSIGKDFIKDGQAKVAARKAYLQEQYRILEATLPPGKTVGDLLRERHSDPNSPFIRIEAEMEERFGPVLPRRYEPSMEEISAFVHTIPGKVYPIYYETGRKTLWVWHIVDTTFLRAWMDHPHFYMVK
jgi:hypothetical protein